MEMSSWSARLVGVDDDGLLNGYGRLFADGEDHAEEDEAPDALGWPGGPFQSLKVQNGFLNRPHLQQAEAPWRQSSCAFSPIHGRRGKAYQAERDLPVVSRATLALRYPGGHAAVAKRQHLEEAASARLAGAEEDAPAVVLRLAVLDRAVQRRLAAVAVIPLPLERDEVEDVDGRRVEHHELAEARHGAAYVGHCHREHGQAGIDAGQTW